MKRLVIIPTIVVFMLIVLELGLRRLFFFSTNYYVPDPILGWRLSPSVRAERNTPEYHVIITTNSHGWRDVEHSYVKPLDAYRIVVLGDSFMEAYGVDLNDAFSRQLEIRFRQAGFTQVEVINLGVGGYGTLQEYLAFIEEGRKYDPDLVLLAFYTANDVQNNSYTLEHAFYEGNEDYHLTSRPFLETSNLDEWRVIPPDYERGLAQLQSRQWWQNTAISTALVRAVESLRQRSLDENIWLGAFLCNESQEYTAAWRITEHILVQLDGVVSDTGAQLIVFTVPSRQEVDTVLNALEEPEGFCFETSMPNARILGILESNGIPHIDLLRAFRLYGDEGTTSLFYPKDPHWNRDGHALAAQIVYETLVERDLLPEE